MAAEMDSAIADRYVANSLYVQQGQPLQLKIPVTELYDTFCQYFDKNGVFHENKTLAWRQFQLRLRQKQLSGRELDGGEDSDDEDHGGDWRPVSYPSFARRKPDNVQVGRDRECCCQACVEIETLITEWALKMRAAHCDANDYSTALQGWRKTPRCADPTCPWMHAPLAGSIPPLNATYRFKNTIVDRAEIESTEKFKDMQCR